MTYYEDLSPCPYFSRFDPLGNKFKAVGWFAAGHPYMQGAVPKEQFHKLLKLLEKPWLPGCFMGYLQCAFCPQGPQSIIPEELVKFVRVDTSGRAPSDREIAQSRTPGTDASHRRRLERDGLVVWFGPSNLFVPADGFIYVAPSMIVHYIDEHRYDPPSAFWEAVLKCPEMHTAAYRKAMIANGPSNESWLRAVHWEGKLEC